LPLILKAAYLGVDVERGIDVNVHWTTRDPGVAGVCPVLYDHMGLFEIAHGVGHRRLVRAALALVAQGRVGVTPGFKRLVPEKMVVV
jgi:hypothetical protein